jgi:hypothetical protein
MWANVWLRQGSTGASGVVILHVLNDGSQVWHDHTAAPGSNRIGFVGYGFYVYDAGRRWLQCYESPQGQVQRPLVLTLQGMAQPISSLSPGTLNLSGAGFLHTFSSCLQGELQWQIPSVGAGQFPSPFPTTFGRVVPTSSSSGH